MGGMFGDDSDDDDDSDSDSSSDWLIFSMYVYLLYN